MKSGQEKLIFFWIFLQFQRQGEKRANNTMPYELKFNIVARNFNQ